MKDFKSLALHPVLSKSLDHMKYNTPTPIQAQAIPFALDGRDVMGSAQTGTGKTAAFAIPLVNALLNNPKGTALVLTPTRELGKQIMEIMHQLLGPKSKINTAFIIGGESMGKQFSQLRAQPRLIVGTPGRINDHLERGSMKLHDTGFLVLDETDRMLDMGFSVQLDRIFKFLPQKRQTLMFSATLPKNIMKMSEKYLNNPERVAVGSTIEPAKNIKQDIIRVTDAEKYNVLLEQLDERMGSIIMFVKTKHGTEKMAKRLKAMGHEAEAIHGDLKQNKRERVIRKFRNMEFRILVATDVVARGLDIPHIEHVINYDLPQVPEDYIHRIGRTARAGAEGHALCIVTPQDGRKWHAIEMLMDPSKKSSGGDRQDFKKGKKKRPFKNGKKRFYDDQKPGQKQGQKSGKKFGEKSGQSTRTEQKPDGKKSFAKKPGGKKPHRGASNGAGNGKPQGKSKSKVGAKDGYKGGNRSNNNGGNQPRRRAA